MTPADRNSNLVIDKGALDCVMCSSDKIDRRMNMYREDVGRFLRLGDLEYEDINSNNNKGREEKGGTTMTPSTAKNATRMNEKKSAMTMVGKKKNNKKEAPQRIMWSCGVSTRYSVTDEYVQVNPMYGT